MSVGVALSPVPVAAVIVILMTPQAAKNGPAFLLGWVAGILAIALVTFFIPGLETARGEPTTLSGIVRIILGIALLALSWRQWQRRPAAGKPVEVPAVLARLDRIGAARSLATGFLLSGINPKNLLLIAAGAATIDASMLAPMGQGIALLLFTIVASLGIAVPVAAYFLAKESAVVLFDHWKAWLIDNNVTILMVLLLVFGTLLIGGGMKIVAS